MSTWSTYRWSSAAGGAAGGTRLPINELGGAMTRRPAGLTEEQVAQHMRRGVEASLGDPAAPILQLSDETYYLDPEGRWVVSTQSTHYRNSRTEVETLLRQRMQGLRSVSFQLPCEEDVLASAFVDKPLCVARKLLKAKREVPTAAQRQEVLAVQQGLCALCGCTVTQSACELDHVVPVRQLFADSVQRLQALCVDCHSEKTLRESAQPTSLESRVCPGVMEAYVRSPKLPPLVFEAQGSHREKPYVGVDVVRCRRNGLANAPFPLPILCPADGVEPVEPGRLPDLGYVEGCRDARQAALQLLPCVGPGWYPKVSTATLRRALERMDAAWPEGEEHMAKLSVNAMIGLSRRADVIYSVRSSSCQLDGPGADFTQSFCYGKNSVWDFVYTRHLLTNGTYRPIHDAVLGFEHCMVAKARRLLAAPPQYVKSRQTAYCSRGCQRAGKRAWRR